MPAAMSADAVSLTGVQYVWRRGDALALDIARFDLARGERLLLKGPSGGGKSTLLALACGVIQPDRGEATVLGMRLAALGATRRDRLRADAMGVIFQMFNLLPYLSLVENVSLPCRFSQQRRDKAARQAGSPEKAALELLTRLGLEEEARAGRPVIELSVGQQQRVAAARALIGAPALIIADEPTSALDAEARDLFVKTLIDEADRTGAALLFASHDESLSRHFERVVALSDINAAGNAARRAA